MINGQTPTGVDQRHLMSSVNGKPGAGTPARRAARRTTCGLTGAHVGLVGALVASALALILWKLSPVPGASELTRWVSFASLPHELRTKASHLLFVPVGALIVVIFRLTLGIRVLGPFRSVLLAVAFQVTGAAIGVALYALVIGVVVVVRPRLKSMKLAYFGRSAAMLVVVAIVIVAAVLVGLAAGVREIENVVYFPVVVLTLSGDAFATALRREGPKAAVWRAGATACVALLITAVASFASVRNVLLGFPELVLVVLAGVILVCKCADFRLLQWLNPSPIKPSRKGKRKPVPVQGAFPAPLVEVSHVDPERAGVA